MTIRVGMIGYGGIGRVHAAAYRALNFYYGLPADFVQIVGVATSKPDSAEKAAREIGCDVWTGDYRDLLARADIDVIDCCTPNATHEEILVAAAAAGKHLYCEKPLSMNALDGARIVAAAARANVKTQLTFNFRFFPAIMRAKQLVDEGFLGRVFSFRGRYYRSSYIDANKPMTWRLRKDASGGGALLDLGSHVLDLLYHLLGSFESVQGTLDTLIPQRPISAGSSETATVDVDDIALLHLRTTNSVLGLVEVSRMGTGATNDLVIEIFGEKGALRFCAADPSWLEIYDTRDADKPIGGTRGFRKVETVQRYDGQKAPDWSMPPDFMRTHAECQYRFLKAVMGDGSPSPTFADGLHIQAVMDAAVHSSQQGRWISIADNMNAP
ncbi:MAG: Gfo/Idh/MocA family oxidoreductase [Chloroflexota bacterium]|nr:Gfo/Idh/MocA family oxidoreductase [Chloroflexota bacterium]